MSRGEFAVTKHTQGPWSVSGSLINTQRRNVARVLHCHSETDASDHDALAPEYGEEFKANCELIAAAPTMLESLKWAARHMRELDPEDEKSAEISKALTVQVIHEGLRAAGITNLAEV